MKNNINKSVTNRLENKKPTTAELTLLTALWHRGPSTVREIHTHVAKQQQTGYTTVLKILQIMHDKGLVSRNESQKAHIYHPVASANQTQAQLIEDLVHKAFAGSSKQLILHALNHLKTKADKNDILMSLQRELA